MIRDDCNDAYLSSMAADDYLVNILHINYNITGKGEISTAWMNVRKKEKKRNGK